MTFNESVAAFFATNKLKWNTDGTAYYEPIEDNNAEGVIYCFVFEWPRLTSTNDIVKNIGIFSHIEPIRPIRQSCALPFFGSFHMNEAVCDLHCIFRIAPPFDFTGIPKADYLFPSEEEDPFYRAAMEIKRKYNIEPYNQFTEYRLEE